MLSSFSFLLAMLRLPPTTITLSAVELQEFCARQKIRLQTTQPQRSLDELILRPKRQKEHYRSAQVVSENNNNNVIDNEPSRGISDVQYGSSSAEYTSDANHSSHEVHLPQGADSRMPGSSEDISPEWYYESHGEPQRDYVDHAESSRGYSMTPQADEIRLGSAEEQLLNAERRSQEDADYLPVSQDSTRDFEYQAVYNRHTAYSPSKHRFDYGGFVESQSHLSSTFIPDDSSSSTPAPQPVSVDVHRLRARLPLPRSPLRVSELVARSPERGQHNNLVQQRVSSYHTPGLLLSQPPRRTPKAYRPRTLSYSYEESERASAVYEEPEPNASDNDESQLGQIPPGGQVSLHEELRGSSLHSVSERSEVPPEMPSSPLVVLHDHEKNRTVYFSSPVLPGKLPPPFSIVSRETSIAGSSTTLARNMSNESAYLAELSPSPPREVAESSHSIHRSGGTLNRIGRMISHYRTRSPERPPKSSSDRTVSSPTTPRPSVLNNSGPSQSSSNVTPRSSVQVYVDSLPPSLQPQTPAHLPESRHRSRLHPSFTAPVTRHRMGPFNTAPRSRARASGFVSRIRRTGGQTDSPLGMGGEQGEGFRGLYGGVENTDEDVLFDNAARRLWETGRARSVERDGNDGIPERELTG